MNKTTTLLNAAANGDPKAAEELLPLVYDQLRRLAAHKMASERAGHTLTATALVHEAYMRLVGNDPSAVDQQNWDGQGHFFAAAAESMRRILVDHARRKSRTKHGGQHTRVELPDVPFEIRVPVEQLLAIDQSLDELQKIDDDAAKIVKLHFFVGMTIAEAARVMGMPERSVYRKWNFARTWLFQALGEEGKTK